MTAGFLHIPHAEDIHNTVTVGNSVGFFLRPYNFFDEDPSINSADSIYFREDQDAGSCEVNSLACLPQVAPVPLTSLSSPMGASPPRCFLVWGRWLEPHGQGMWGEEGLGAGESVPSSSSSPSRVLSLAFPSLLGAS